MSCSKLLALASLALVASCAPAPPETAARPPEGAPAGWSLAFAYTFDHLDTTVWSLGTHTFDGNAAQFRPYNAKIRHGHLELVLHSDHFEDREYSGAELELRQQYKYGRFEVRMRAAKGSAVISSWFGYAEPPWREIDIEFLGDHPNAVQSNVYNSPDANPTLIPPFPILRTLPFDATAGFHTYAFEWEPHELRWYADTILVAKTTNASQVPTREMRPMLNLWLSTTASWAGAVDPSILPAHSEYQWVRIYQR
jgi:endo-1,3-1,4-beta-glycanase ExoK